MTIEEAFGEVIRKLRKANQISQEKLAEVSKLDRSFISLLECGRKQPSLIMIFQLSKAISGHKTSSVFDRYNIINNDDLKEATQKQEKYLQLQNGYNPGIPPKEKDSVKRALIVSA